MSSQGTNQTRPGRIRFGPYEADVSAGELRRNGRPVRLQEQPFLVLAALLDRAGEVVGREELRERLWPGASFGDFDQGLNTAINKLREALGDSAANPRFIETLPKRGYRFTHPLEVEPAASPIGVAPVRPRWFRARRILLPAAIVMIAISGFAILRISGPAKQSELPLRRWTIPFPAPIGVPPDVRQVAISPNGKHIAFVGGEHKSRLWVQDLDQQQPRVIEESDGALSPFWSPDSKMIAFTIAGKIRKVAVTGGPITSVCDMPNFHISGGAWSPDSNRIVFAAGPPSSLYTIASAGGTASLLVSPEMLDKRLGKELPGAGPSSGFIIQPQFVPAEDGSAVVLFTYYTGGNPALVLLDFKTRRPHVIGSGWNAFYSSTGHLLYRSGTDLWGRRFSPKRSQFAGEAFRVARNAIDPTIASDGTLVYRDGSAQQLVWLDRSGARRGTAGLPANGLYYPALSPDLGRVAVETLEQGNLDVWISDLLRGTRVRLTLHPATDILPVWAPEGDTVAFSSYRDGNADIFIRRADAGSEATALATMPQNERVSDWSQDGEYILYSLRHAKNGYDLWYLKRNAGGRWESHALLETPFDEKTPKFSPDGRYVAYLSDESGRDELYVRPFPSGARKWLISTRGASQIRWSRKSGELFYVEGRTLIAVSVRTRPEFAAGATTRLFSHAGFTDVPDPNYDISPDGQRIILPDKVGTEDQMIRVVQNWFAEFRDIR